MAMFLAHHQDYGRCLEVYQRPGPPLMPPERGNKRLLQRRHLCWDQDDGLLADQRSGAAGRPLRLKLLAVRGHHRFVDELLGGLRADMPANGVLVLVGDPGRLARESGPAEGLIALSGASVATGAIDAAGERDVAPTVLHLMGLPVSDELEGRVLESALSPAFRSAHPVRRVSSYGSRPQGRLRESAFDREMLEELRSLGYIQ
jgi:hypothetical protein